jgi:asparagine synthase (glutamine-hydrolysing)
VERALGYVPTWIAAKAAFGKRVRALLREDWPAGGDPAQAIVDTFDLKRLEGRGRVECSAYLWTKLALEGYILRALGDGLEMASSVEGRLPFLDSALFDAARTLPTSAKIRDGVEKWILREAVRDRLPPRIVTREKHPFLAPPMGPRTLEVARDAVASASFRNQPAFDPQKAAGLLGRLPSMSEAERKAHDPVAFFLVSIAVLQARWGLA